MGPNCRQAMIYWLLQSQTAQPDLARNEVPPGLLAPSEARRLQAMTSPERRRDWLLGRWTAKRLLQQVMEKEDGVDLPLDGLIIEMSRNGAPRATFRPPWTGRDFAISLSHSHGVALCAVSGDADVALGVDLEWIEPRSTRFVGDFLTGTEAAHLGESSRATHVSALWSAKEAVLKALGLGFHVDAKAVTCHIETPAARPDAWLPFAVTLHPEHLPSAESLPTLRGWWQVSGGFVLTLVTN